MSLVVRDESHAGHILGGAVIDGLASLVTLRELLRIRVTREVEDYNADPGDVFRGLVQPADSIAVSDGFRMRSPRTLDPDHHVRAAEEAVRRGLLHAQIGDTDVGDLDDELDLRGVEELVLVKRRPVVATPPDGR